MTPNRGRGNVNHPADDEDAPEVDELWEQVEKQSPGKMDQLYKQFLRSTNQRDTDYESGKISNAADDQCSPKAFQLMLLMNCLVNSDFNKRLSKGQVSGYKKPILHDAISQFKCGHAVAQDVCGVFKQIGVDMRLEMKDIKIVSDDYTAFAVEVKGTEAVGGVKKPYTKTVSVTMCKNPDSDTLPLSELLSACQIYM